MASQSLYRKWRSQTFSDLVGQEEIVQTLRNAVADGKPSHAYLFTGPRGTGKTSTARLLAKTLNCTNLQNGEPCNECEQCREITAGNSFNVIEIDAASNRGIDSIRELREKVMVRPSTGRYKIYILDEAHMLTTEAFNALLKTLEEPPEHAIFVMATTDVHKMLPTVLSRCQRFDFKRITTRQIVKHLQFVATQEKVELERGASELIARAAAGGMRDALSLLDQAIAYSGERISLAQVQTMLGIADPRAIQKFITHIAQLDSAGGLHLIHELAEAGADLRQINSQVAEYWRAMMLVRAGASIATILDSTEDEVREITQTAQLFSLDELTDCARIFAQNELMQKNQGTPQLGLELALLSAIGRHRNASPVSPDAHKAPEPSIAKTNVSGTPAAPKPITPTAFPTSTASTLPPISRPAPVTPQPANVSSVAPIEQKDEAQVSKEPGSATNTERVDPEMSEVVETHASDNELPEWDTLSYSDDEEDFERVTPIVALSSELATTPVQSVQSEQSASVDIPEHDTPEREDEPVEQESLPLFTLADAREKWEQIKRRVKSRKEGVIAASILNDFAVVAVQGTLKEALVIAQAAHQWHYDKIQQKDYYKVIEWALKIELSQECRIQFLSPTQSIPVPPPLLSSSLSHLSPPLPGRSSQGQREPHHSNESHTNGTNGTGIASPLARKHSVRENTSSRHDDNFFSSTVYVDDETVSGVSGIAEVTIAQVTEMSQPAPAPIVLDETRRAVLERKAKADPVVQKVTETFRASMKEVRPK